MPQPNVPPHSSVMVAAICGARSSSRSAAAERRPRGEGGGRGVDGGARVGAARRGGDRHDVAREGVDALERRPVVRRPPRARDQMLLPLGGLGGAHPRLLRD